MNCPNCNSSNLDTKTCINYGLDFSGSTIIETSTDNVYKGPLYLHISIKRLIIISILSIGLYEAYWVYKNWSFIKKRRKLKIQPFWRGFFTIFFCHKLLNQIHDDSELNKVETPNFNPSTLATWWVITTFIGNGANRLTDKIEEPVIEFVVLFISTLTFFFFIPVQRYINDVHERLEYNEKYSLWSAGHIVCIVWGVIIWGLIFCELLLK